MENIIIYVHGAQILYHYNYISKYRHILKYVMRYLFKINNH